MVTSRVWFTAAQKAELRERWKNGQSAAAISRALERKNKTGVERIVVLHGGIVPAPRRRALAVPRLEVREESSRSIAVGVVICTVDTYAVSTTRRRMIWCAGKPAKAMTARFCTWSVAEKLCQIRIIRLSS
jgi:hypothetical protein